jgi:pyruvate dehydrogenase E2 component (dihydrolipoamide acetyltransferase)
LKAAGKAPVPKSASPVASQSPPIATEATMAGDGRAPMPEGAVAMNGMQKAVVQNMNASLNVPVFRVSYAIKTAAFDELYAKLKSKGVTVSALLAKAVAITLAKHPILNAAYAKDTIIYRPNINVAMAVALPDGGLMTPTLKDADKTDLYSLSRNWKDLVKRTMEKSIKPDEYNSGTFFISNLGMYGVDFFDAILPPGAPAILAVAASKPVVGMQANGLIGAHKEMLVNITCDHRHIYGAQAAAFLRDLAGLLENDVMQLVL